MMFRQYETTLTRQIAHKLLLLNPQMSVRWLKWLNHRDQLALYQALCQACDDPDDLVRF